ncbi:hypothetical protein Bca4012_102567 [Brassica carinata]
MCASQRVSKPVRRKEADWLILTVHSRPTLIFREGFECEHTCRDPKDGELCLSGRPEETLVEARSDTDANRSPDLELAMRDEPKPGYGAQLRANLEPTKGVGRQDSRTVVMEVEPLRRGRAVAAKPRARARRSAAGADLGGSSKYSNENFEGRRGERFHVNGTCTWGVRDAGRNSKELSFLFNSLPTPETAQPEVSKVNSLWSMEQCRQGKSAKWIRNFGKGLARGLGSGSQFNPPTVGGLLEPLTWRERPPRVGRGRTGNGSFELSRRRTANSELCSECQSEEIQPSAVNGGVTMTLLSQGNGLGRISGKEDPVELDSSPTL